ncbi:NACHT domain-containing protein [Pantoea vagans]|uniref:NACHT domain-containing protein n=1 Tax=Pantoea vagans TaxID=470934 RepID=UPI00050E59B1|nr:hypothetical protein [Pantoea vagans]KGD76114.1 hypothetical protein ID11_10590 [Pantoea vagans]
MPESHELSQLDSNSFEHLVNALALNELGKGITGFATGPDGGRDGYLSGKANYPTTTECWEGTWFIQSKFHKPHLSTNAQTWILNEVKKEIEKFSSGLRHTAPDNWIIATNVDLSGAIHKGTYDKIKNEVLKYNENINVDIWGGSKIIAFIIRNPDIAKAYGHFLTPGHVITKLYESLSSKNKSIENYINHNIYKYFEEFNYTKLDQAGATGDQRQKIYHLFRDLPVDHEFSKNDSFIMDCLVSASSKVQKNSAWINYGSAWKLWCKDPKKSRVILIKGGPGQGKSTAGQYFSQIQRAAFILSGKYKNLQPKDLEYAGELKREAEKYNFWPTIPRIPLFVELKDYARWYTSKTEFEPKNIVEYLIFQLKKRTSIDITAEMIHEAFQISSWFINFDGLDEVPNDAKDQIANEINSFTNDLIPFLDADFLVLATTRPQGYSGQFENLNSADVTLLPLTPEIALECATPLLEHNRSQEEFESSLSILKSAMDSEQVKELMTTPLQAHIMAVVVRDGGRPPEKRWTLFNNFYSVMKKRESLKNFPDLKIQSLLREREQLLKSIHDRLGISLHSKAEKSLGAEATLDRKEFETLARQTVVKQIDHNVDSFVLTLMEATRERLVFVNTPDNSETVRFDIRQLQEFFAAEFIYTAVSNDELRKRVMVICGDAHWREVIHFLLSALISHLKLGELAVVVGILQSLDDDSHNNITKSFKKNMGRGALLTLRLLSEGVLEEDRQIRQPFAKSLYPIWSMLEIESINKIVSVNKEQSRYWLINNLIETMVEMDFSEHIVSGYLASIMLPDNHPRLDEVKQRLLNAPDFYIATTYNLHYEHENFPPTLKMECQLWFLEFTLNIFFNSSARKNKTADIILSFIIRNKEYIKKNIDHLKITPTSKYALKALVLSEMLHASITKPISEKDSEKYCFAQFELAEKNWYTNPENDLLEHTMLSPFEQNSYISLLIRSINFYILSDISNFKELLIGIINNDYDITIIPNFIKFMIPIQFETEFFNEKVEMLNNLSPEELSLILQSKGKGVLDFSKANGILKLNQSDFDVKKWLAFVNDFPEAAISIAFDQRLDNKYIQAAKSSDAVSFYKPLLEVILAKPEFFVRYFFRWNEIFQVFPENKNALLAKLSELPVASENTVFLEKSNQIHFNINLHERKALIVHLANSLFFTSLIFEYNTISRVHITVKNFDVEFFKGFGIDVNALISISKDHTQNDLLRASALSCFLALGNSKRINYQDMFFENELDACLNSLINDVTIEILCKGLYVFLFNIQNPDDRFAKILGSFSLKSKTNMKVRMLIQPIYKRWRERSSAPVEEGQHLNGWLNYNFPS